MVIIRNKGEHFLDSLVPYLPPVSMDTLPLNSEGTRLDADVACLRGAQLQHFAVVGRTWGFTLWGGLVGNQGIFRDYTSGVYSLLPYETPVSLAGLQDLVVAAHTCQQS